MKSVFPPRLFRNFDILVILENFRNFDFFEKSENVLKIFICFSIFEMNFRDEKKN